jgi:hypothetical protein
MNSGIVDLCSMNEVIKVFKMSIHIKEEIPSWLQLSDVKNKEKQMCGV